MTETFPDARETLYGEMKKNWGWMLAGGIIMLVLGFIGLGMTFALTLVSVLYYGILVLIGSGVQIADAFRCKGWKSVVWHVLIALVYLAAGIIIISDPLLASQVFTLLIAWSMIAIGVMRGIVAFQMRGGPGWLWILSAGIAAILLGVMILAEWPVSGLWVIGMFVAIELIFNGWSYVMIALAAKNAGEFKPSGA